MAASKSVTAAAAPASVTTPPILKGYLKNVGTGKYVAFKFKDDFTMESDIDAVLTTDLAKTIELTITSVTIPKAAQVPDGPKIFKLVHWDENMDNWILDHCDKERIFLTNEDSTSQGQRWVIEDVQTESGVLKKIKESQGTMYLTAEKLDSDALVLRNVENPLELLWLWNLSPEKPQIIEKSPQNSTDQNLNTEKIVSPEKPLGTEQTPNTEKNPNPTTEETPTTEKNPIAEKIPTVEKPTSEKNPTTEKTPTTEENLKMETD